MIRSQAGFLAVHDRLGGGTLCFSCFRRGGKLVVNRLLGMQRIIRQFHFLNLRQLLVHEPPPKAHQRPSSFRKSIAGDQDIGITGKPLLAKGIERAHGN